MRTAVGDMAKSRVNSSSWVSQSTVRSILDRHGIQPVPVRNSSIGWRHLRTHYKEQILACDFFTIDTVWLQTIYVLCFIEMGSRRIHFAGVTSNPNQTWITQQARQLVWDLHDRGRCLQFLIHDNDCSFSKVFDAVFSPKASMSFTLLFRLPMQMLTPNGGFVLSGKNAWIICSSSMPSICGASWPNLLNTTTLLGPIKVSISRCPFPALDLRTLALFNVERYSVGLSTITFVERTAISFPPFDFISVQYPPFLVISLYGKTPVQPN